MKIPGAAASQAVVCSHSVQFALRAMAIAHNATCSVVELPLKNVFRNSTLSITEKLMYHAGNLDIGRHATVTLFAVINYSISTLCADVRVWNVVQTNAETLS